MSQSENRNKLLDALMQAKLLNAMLKPHTKEYELNVSLVEMLQSLIDQQKPDWVGFTVEELWNEPFLERCMDDGDYQTIVDVMLFARDLDDKLREKNYGRV